MNDDQPRDHNLAPAPGEGREPAYRAGGREPIFDLPGVVTAAIAVMILIETAKAYLLDDAGITALLVEGAVIPARYTSSPIDGAWFWSPVTYSFIHGGWLHLIINAFWLAAFGAIVARRIGTVRFVLFWVLSAIASAAVFTALHHGETLVMVGASGVVSALMAAAARFAFQATNGFNRNMAHLWPRLTIGQSLANKSVVGFLIVWFGINMLAAIGIAPGAGEATIAWEAHVGGFLFGFLAFGLFDQASERA